MKVLACSDIHGKIPVYEWIVQITRKFNPSLIVMAGDLFGYSGNFQRIEDAQTEEIKKIERILGRVSLPILYVMGNDDAVPFHSKLPNVHHIHSSVFEYHEYVFTGYEYSLPFTGGIYEKAEDEIADDLDRLHHLITERTILVSHSPAYGILDTSSMGIHCGSQAILNFIKTHQMVAHIHGHVHESYGNHGIHFNVSSGAQRRAMLIDLKNLVYETLRFSTY